MIAKRLDTTSDFQCHATAACPAVFRLDDGDYAIIGADETATIIAHLPKGSGCADHEKIVRVPRSVFENAVTNF